MNIKDIAALAEIVRQNELTRLEVDGSHVIIERMPAAVQNTPIQQAAPAAASVPAQPAAPAAQPAEEAKEGIVVTSPTVGVFYAAPAPGSKPFVTLGDTVHKGDVLCIVEAMKLMNEIICETDGKIAEICVGNGQVVEYDQPLFRIV